MYMYKYKKKSALFHCYVTELRFGYMVFFSGPRRGLEKERMYTSDATTKIQN